MAGRASKYTEVVRADALGELFDKARAVLDECLSSDNKTDRKWAAEQVMKLAAKTVPQQTAVTGEDGGALKIEVVNYANTNSIQLATGTAPTTDTTTPS